MYHRIVVKLGTSVLTAGTDRLDQARMVELARQCAMLHGQGIDVLLCSSGAIAAGRKRLNRLDLPDTLTTKQMLAAVGQSRLMLTWERLFEIYQVHVGQLLLTRADVEDRERYLNARDTVMALLQYRIVPIINENDAVATAEIKVGDNDNLSALAAVIAEADLLVMLTDQPGLYTADPRSDPAARLIEHVESIDEHLRAVASGTTTGLGVGGMATKLQAADIARRAGVDVCIASGSETDVVLRLARGEHVGTRIPAVATRLDHRKRWILAGPAPKGTLSIDAGAAVALRDKGSSLLPAGIVRIEGAFSRGDTVTIEEETRHEVARGIVRYANSELRKIAGCHSERIAERLGFTNGPAVHRNDLILVG